MPFNPDLCGPLHRKPFEERLQAQITVAPSGCWLFQGYTNEKGYGRIRYKGKKELVHRAAYMHYVGEIPEGMLVCHECDVPGCCNPEHLFTGSNADNIADRDAKGRHRPNPNGRRGIPSSRMSMEKAEQIRKEFRRGMSIVRIAANYGFCERTINRVINREITGHKPEAPHGI